MKSVKSEFKEYLLRDDLLRSCLCIGAIATPSLDLNKYVERVMGIAARAWSGTQGKKDPILKLQRLNQVLFNEFKFRGKDDAYKKVIDDPKRSYIHFLLDTGLGNPTSVAILYCILAEQIGIEFECLGLPNYIFLRIHDVTGEFFVDPFDKGRLLTPEEFQRRLRSAMAKNRMISTNLFEKIHTRQLAGRLLQQLKHIYILKGSAVEALQVVEMLTLIFPESPELTRDRGILYCEMEYFSKAIEDLKFYLQKRPQADDIGEIKKLANMLRGYREVMN